MASRNKGKTDMPDFKPGDVVECTSKGSSSEALRWLKVGQHYLIAKVHHESALVTVVGNGEKFYSNRFKLITEFKVGDIVKCVDKRHCLLTVGDYYSVKSVSSFGISLKEAYFSDYYYNNRLFKLLCLFG